MTTGASNDTLRCIQVYSVVRECYQHSVRIVVRRRCLGTYLASEIESITLEAFAEFFLVLHSERWRNVTLENWKEQHLNIRRFLLGVAQNSVRRSFRRSSREAPCIVDIADICVYEPACPLLRAEIKAAVNKCPPSEKEVILLKMLGFKHQEIADELKLSTNAVRIRYCRAINRLKSILKDYADLI